MKSLTAVCQTGASMPAMKPQSGRIQRPPQHRTNGENAEMRMYLSKLKDLVPFMPKNRKLSKLEIIQHVIDYICELQTELESHPDIDSYDGARELLATPNRHQFALEALNAVRSANDHDDNDEDTTEIDQHYHDSNDNDHDADDDSMMMMIGSGADASARLAADAANQQQQHHHQQQQQSSPAVRQPLVDRNTPNTILPLPATTNANVVVTSATMQQYHLQFQQQQQTTSASAANATLPTTATTTNITPAAAVTSAEAAAAAATTASVLPQNTPMIITTEKEQSRRNC